MTKKMTRRDALQTAIEIMDAWVRENFDDGSLASCNAESAIDTLQNMIIQIDKQASRPKGKTSARIENERFAVQFIAAIRGAKKEVNATWIAEHVPIVRTAQRATHVAKIAEEWGAVERVTIKKRTYYKYVEDWRPLPEVAAIIRKCV